MPSPKIDAPVVHRRGDRQLVALRERAGDDGGAGRLARPRLANEEGEARVDGGRKRGRWLRSREIESAQPLAPVPVATMRPEDDWSSWCRRRRSGSAPTGATRWPTNTSLRASRRWPSSRLGLDHGAVLGDGGVPGAGVDELAGSGGPVGDEHARVAFRLGVDADDGLAVEVLGGVGDEAVLAEHDDDVGGLEDEHGRSARPTWTNRQRTGTAARMVWNAAPKRRWRSSTSSSDCPRVRRKNLRLLAGAVPGDQGLVVGRPGHQDDAGLAAALTSRRCPTRSSRSRRAAAAPAAA